MPVLSIHDLTISFSGPAILDSVQLHIDQGERVCIVGRNGAGKSTLLKVILGEYMPNTGIITFPSGGKPAALPQVSPDSWDTTVYDAIATGYGEDGAKLIASRDPAFDTDLDPDQQWKMEERIESLISHFGLDPQAAFESLSGGQKRRVLLAKALVAEPVLLVLDEPTNHMDVDSIVWLERYLTDSKTTLIFVTHDRAFLKNVATRIIEVDLAQLTSYNCNYDTYLVRKEELLEAERKNREAFDKKLSQEEAWLRKGIRARRTRNEGRVRALKKLRDERQGRRERQGSSDFELQQAAQSGRKAITAEAASFSVDGTQILQPFDLEITSKDRIGIIGPNGSGKSTLIKLLLQRIPATTGAVAHGTKLEICYFDQMREALDEELSVFDNIAAGNETVSFGGRQVHVMTYLKDFLFTPDRARSSTKTLSGGERNRLLLAKLFTKPTNFLVMDEPTNDLDTETLELLEDLLMEFKGTLILVSHDRAFLDNTVTSIIAIDKNGSIEEHVGGYDDWLLRKARASPTAPSRPPSAPKANRKNWKTKTERFTRKEQQELDSIPDKVDSLDQEKETLAAVLADPNSYLGDPQVIKDAKTRIDELGSELERAYERWQELEAKREELA